MIDFLILLFLIIIIYVKLFFQLPQLVCSEYQIPENRLHFAIKRK